MKHTLELHDLVYTSTGLQAELDNVGYCALLGASGSAARTAFANFH